MHKHRAYKRARSSVWRNANSPISSAASNTIVDLFAEVDWGDDFSVAYLFEQYKSKYCSEDLVPAADRANAAIDKWIATEERNRHTNSRLRELDPGYNILPRVTYSSFLKFARRLVSEILGPLRDNVALGAFSSGASTSRRRTHSLPAMKFSDKADATSTVSQYVDIVHRQAPLLKQFGIFNSLNEVDGAVLFTVPKKTDIDRCACKEPDFNMFLQKGVGRHIRSRLKRFGVNLNDQSVNRKLAHAGSLTGELATLDLSSASDTITIEAVRALLPSDWFLYLNDIRSQQVEVRGETYRTEMFSSMGNGFTFELESLLFYSIVRTVTYFEGIPGIVSVYGDDIICPSKAYGMVSWALQEFGFSVNDQKSFSTGFFRESCGGHYHFGEDVTPFYLKRYPTHLTDVIRVANQLRRWACSGGIRKYSLPAIYNLWLKLASEVPKDLWGGYDTEVDTVLASPGGPNKQLVRLSAPQKLPQIGAYIHWHNSNWTRTQDPSEPGFEPVTTNNQCRKRSMRKSAPHCALLFYEEEIA